MHVNGKLMLLRKLVLEVRYAFGNTYFDRMGETINLLADLDWMPIGPMQPQGTNLVSMTNKSTLVVTAANLAISLEQQQDKSALEPGDVATFAAQSARAIELITNTLTLREYLRIGFRSWHYFGGDSVADCETWLRSLNLVQTTPSFAALFGSEIEAQQSVFVIATEDRKLRLSFGSVEVDPVLDLDNHGTITFKARNLPKNQRQAFVAQAAAKRKKLQNPQSAAVIDIDAYQDDPPLIDPEHFVTSSFEGSERVLADLDGRKQK